MNDSLIKETGSKVKCSKCEKVFVVYPPTLSGEADLDTGLDDFEEEFEDLPSLQDEDGDAGDLDLRELDNIFDEDGGFWRDV
jgi:hypothetical protein